MQMKILLKGDVEEAAAATQSFDCEPHHGCSIAARAKTSVSFSTLSFYCCGVK